MQEIIRLQVVDETDSRESIPANLDAVVVRLLGQKPPLMAAYVAV